MADSSEDSIGEIAHIGLNLRPINNAIKKMSLLKLRSPVLHPSGVVTVSLDVAMTAAVLKNLEF